MLNQFWRDLAEHLDPPATQRSADLATRQHGTLAAATVVNLLSLSATVVWVWYLLSIARVPYVPEHLLSSRAVALYYTAWATVGFSVVAVRTASRGRSALTAALLLLALIGYGVWLSNIYDYLVASDPIVEFLFMYLGLLFLGPLAGYAIAALACIHAFRVARASKRPPPELDAATMAGVREYVRANEPTVEHHNAPVTVDGRPVRPAA